MVIAGPSYFRVEWPAESHLIDDCIHDQGIVTNGTDDVWLSCQWYLVHGKLEYDQVKRPVRFNADSTNRHALAQAQNVSGVDYKHISDGDSGFNQKTGANELWFGIEGGGWLVRALNGSITRYDATTLELIALHEHPSMKTVPWMAFDSKRQLAYTNNWTDSGNQLYVFDAAKEAWVDNITIQAMHPDDDPVDLYWIQGAAIRDDVLYLQNEGNHSILYGIALQNMTLVEQHEMLFGHEREGIAFAGDYLLAMGNSNNFIPINDLCTAGMDNTRATVAMLSSLLAMAVVLLFCLGCRLRWMNRSRESATNATQEEESPITAGASLESSDGRCN